MSAPPPRRPPIRALLIDLSGTLHTGPAPLPGAPAALARLRAARVPFRVCSNTSTLGGAALAARLAGMGLAAAAGGDGAAGAEEAAWTSVRAAGAVLRARGVRRPYMLLEDSARDEIAAALGTDAGAGADADGAHDAVVVGLAPARLDYAHLNTAFRILVREEPAPAPSAPADTPADTHADTPGPADTPAPAAPAPVPAPAPPLIALHRARYVQTRAGLALGPGAFVAALEAAARVRAHAVGKPARAFFAAALRALARAPGLADLGRADVLGADGAGEGEGEGEGEGGEAGAGGRGVAGAVAIVGDDVEADLGGGAAELGLWRVLVRTGKYRAGDETRAGVLPPDEVADSFAAFVDALLDGRAARL